MKHNKYIDTFAGLYVDNYPILSLSDTDFFENYRDNLKDLLKNCIWFKLASEPDKKVILSKFKNVLGVLEEIRLIIKNKYPNLYIKHISIGGSYLFKADEVNDIDFNVIVSGSYFSYDDISEIDAINKKLPLNLKRISIMIFGEDDFLFRTNVFDTIETPDYIHTSLCMREGLVFSMRNVTVYGHLFRLKDIDKVNLLMRIKRQLFHAKLMLEDEVDLHRDVSARLLKSIGRISEAFLYLSVVFPQLKINPKDILEKEKTLSKFLNRTNIVSWLQEGFNCVVFLSNLIKK